MENERENFLLLWRQEEGERIRATKGREGSPDPDWSLVELAARLPELVEEFFGWRRENPRSDETLRVAFEVWAKLRWDVPLPPAGRGMVLGAIVAALKNKPVETKLTLPAKIEDEHSFAYIERICEANGLSLELPKGTRGFSPAAAALSPRVLVPPKDEPRKPYKDPEDSPHGEVDFTKSEARGPEYLECSVCHAELGPLDTKFCSDACREIAGEGPEEPPLVEESGS